MDSECRKAFEEWSKATSTKAGHRVEPNSLCEEARLEGWRARGEYEAACSPHAVASGEAEVVEPLLRKHLSDIPCSVFHCGSQVMMDEHGDTKFLSVRAVNTALKAALAALHPTQPGDDQ